MRLPRTILGEDVDPEYADNPIFGQVYARDTYADPTKMRKAMGREPQVGFEEGIRPVCEPYKNSE